MEALEACPLRGKQWFMLILENWHLLHPAQVVRAFVLRYNTPNSRESALCDIKKFARENYPYIHPQWIRLLRLPRNFHKKQRRSRYVQIIERGENPIDCFGSFYLGKMCEFLMSPDPVEMAVGLLMATGRRSIEVAQTAKFKATRTVHEPFPDFWVRFAGQAKKSEATKRNPPYDIPVLVRSDQLIECFERFRATDAPRNVHSSFWQKDVMQLVKTNFPEYVLHSCRRVFAPLTHVLFNPPKAINVWAMRILGHEVLNTGIPYLSVHLVDTDPPKDSCGLALPFQENARRILNRGKISE